MSEKLNSHIIICENIEEKHEELKEILRGYRVVSFVKDDFLVDDSRGVIAEAYISEADTKYIILGAKSFNAVSQNSLLKILEEPPRNIEFIIITSSKSALLPTVRSRLRVEHFKSEKSYENLELDLKRFDIAQLFAFVKKYDRLKAHDAKELLESLMNLAVNINGVTLSKTQAEAFELAYYLVNLNGRFQTILINLLMTFLPKSVSK
ncbi:MAG: DNA polymerase III subunit delta' [Helicobacteraceae bacterium]|nr:DNA polymerase III subunit delta' [Helicobacteraceae bacterium]